MASPASSSDEGEIVEATTLPPRSEQNGDVDRTGRPRGRVSPSPEFDSASRTSRDASHRPSRSPRGFKRARDDRDRRDRDRDPRHFHIHYEDRHDDPRRYRDLDRPPSRSSNHRFPARDRDSPSTRSRPADYRRDRDVERRHEDRPDKRPRNRSRSPYDRRVRDRRDRGRNGRESYAEQTKYSTHNERPSHHGPMSKRAASVEPPIAGKESAKSAQGDAVVNGTAPAAAPRTSKPQAAPDRDMVDADWDGELVDPEAAVEAEIQRRKRLREEALKRALGAQSATGLPDDKVASTPASTQNGTPVSNPLKTEGTTPRSASDANSPAVFPDEAHDAPSPAALAIANDQDLANKHRAAKPHEEDGPSAADYDPTADMKEDERRDELRHGNLGAYGDEQHPEAIGSNQDISVEPPKTRAEDDDDDFDMFAEELDEEKIAAAAPKAPQAKAEQPVPAGGGGILELDDKDGYFKIRPGETLDGRYQISTTLGRGMFSGVARAVDVTNQKIVAIKIMRNNDALRKGGFTEIAILQKLNAADPDHRKHIVRFERSFEYKGHLCMVFENLSLNLREVLKKFGNNVGINLKATRAYAYQIFIALGHMRKCSIIHADLKPDNILVNENRSVLKICDLGTAIDRSDAATASTEITPYLVSRFYRAPEIILGMPYDYAVDMWSIGCTLYELYTGKILFTGDSNNQMLKTIMEIRGKLSPKMYRRGQLSADHFDDMGNFMSVERDKVLGKTTIRTLTIVKPTRDIRTRLVAASSGMDDAESRELNHFVDLLERCLALNPDRRINPSEALRHPFFTHKMHGSGR